LDQHPNYFQENKLEDQINDNWNDMSDQYGQYTTAYKHKDKHISIRVSKKDILELDFGNKKFSDTNLAYEELHHILSYRGSSPDTIEFLYEHYLEN